MLEHHLSFAAEILWIGRLFAGFLYHAKACESLA